MLIKSLGIDPVEMKEKGEQIYNWVAGKIESIDDRLSIIMDSNARIEANQQRIMSVMGIPEKETPALENESAE